MQMWITRAEEQQYDAVIVDFRGVLYRKTEKDRRAFFRYLNTELGLPKHALQERLPGLDGKLRPAAVARILEATFEIPAVHQKLSCAPGMRRSVPIAENVALLPRLARRYKLGLLANGDGTVERRLTVMGLRCYFNSVVDSDILGIRKPDLRIFEHALADLVVRPDRCLFVDDRIENVEAARSLGMTAIHYRHERGDDLAAMFSAAGVDICPARSALRELAAVS